jgi:hypothetical protein
MLSATEILNASVNAAAALLNSGTLLIRENTTTILSFALKAQAFAAASGGAALLDVASPAMSATGSASATAVNNYQFRTSGAAVRLSGSVGLPDSGAEIEINHVDVQLGDIVDMIDFELSMPPGA